MDNPEESFDLVRLDHRAQTYFELQLDFETIFCDTLASVLRKNDGDFFVMLPRRLDTDCAYNFEDGDLLEENELRVIPPAGGLVPVRTMVDRQAKLIRSFLQSGDTALCIIDDAVARASPPKFIGPATVLNDSGAALYTMDEQTPIVDIEAALRRGNHIWHGVTALCRPAAQVLTQKLAEPDALRECVASVEEMHAVAYDGEGFLIWRRR